MLTCTLLQGYAAISVPVIAGVDVQMPAWLGDYSSMMMATSATALSCLSALISPVSQIIYLLFKLGFVIGNKVGSCPTIFGAVFAGAKGTLAGNVQDEAQRELEDHYAPADEEDEEDQADEEESSEGTTIVVVGAAAAAAAAAAACSVTATKSEAQDKNETAKGQHDQTQLQPQQSALELALIDLDTASGTTNTASNLSSTSTARSMRSATSVMCGLNPPQHSNQQTSDRSPLPLEIVSHRDGLDQDEVGTAMTERAVFLARACAECLHLT